jgi:hypothetical protein
MTLIHSLNVATEAPLLGWTRLATGERLFTKWDYWPVLTGPHRC